MYWHKVKTMLIVLFALINAFLVGMICFGKIQEAVLIKKMNNDTRAVLVKNGITIDMDIPRRAGEMPSVLLSAVFESDEAAVDAFLGGNADKSEAKDGGTLYLKGDKSLFVYGGYIEFDSGSMKESAAPVKKDIKKAEKLLEGMGINTKNLHGEINGNKIVFTYSLGKNRKIFADLELSLAGDTLQSARGYLLSAQKGEEKLAIRPAAEALVEFVQNNQKESMGNMHIKSVALGYTLFLSDTKVAFTSAEAIPAWVITIENGQNIYYDARKNI